MQSARIYLFVLANTAAILAGSIGCQDRDVNETVARGQEDLSPEGDTPTPGADAQGDADLEEYPSDDGAPGAANPLIRGLEEALDSSPIFQDAPLPSNGMPPPYQWRL